jgi:hypothetical protein
MSSQFKFKPDKIKHLNNIDTLDSSHKKIINNINKKRDEIPLKEKKLLKLKNTLEILDSKPYDNNYVSQRTKLLDQINELSEEINKIENFEDELEYYEKTHEILFNYYDIVDGHKIVSVNNINNNSINNINKNDFSSDTPTTNNLEFSDIKINSNNHPINTNNLFSDIEINKESNEKSESEFDLELEKNPNKKMKKMNQTDISDISSNQLKQMEKNDKNNLNDWDIEGIDIFKKSNVPDRLDILNQLSKSKRKEKKTTRKRVKNVESLIRDSNNIYDYLEGKTDKSSDNKNENNGSLFNSSNNNPVGDKKIQHYDRASLFEDYKILLDGYPTQKRTNKPCLNCGPTVNKVMIYSEGIYACLICGEVEKCIIENEISSYKDPNVEKPTFPYKRKNHFCEWTISLIIIY